MADETTFKFVYVDETQDEPPVERGAAERSRPSTEPQVERRAEPTADRSSPAQRRAEPTADRSSPAQPRGDDRRQASGDTRKPEREPTWAGKLMATLDEFTKSVRDLPWVGRAASQGDRLIRPFLKGADSIARASNDRQTRMPLALSPTLPTIPFPASTGSASPGGAAGGTAARSGAAALVSPIGLLAISAGAATLALAAVAVRSKQVADSLAGYSGVLAAAKARAQAAQTIQDIRSAQTLGPQLARFTEANSRMSIAMQRLLDEISVALLPVITKGVEGAVWLLEGVAADTSAMRKAWESGDWAKIAKTIFSWDDSTLQEQKERDIASAGLLADLAAYPDLTLDDTDARAKKLRRFDVTPENFADIPAERLQ